MYGSFASIYDELMDDIDYNKWFNYIEKIYTRYEVSVNKTLEMACGTGNLSKFLADKGYDLTCFDLSIDMLTIADSKLRDYKNVKILNQDMTSFNLSEKYDSIISICDSINYVTEDEDLINVFKNVYSHLEDGGVFIFDINSKYKLEEIIGNNIFVEDREDIFYTWESYFDEIEKINEFYINFFVKEENDKYIRFIEQHYERAYEVEEIIKFLNQAGFSKIDYFVAFTFNQIDEKTERINFIIRK